MQGTIELIKAEGPKLLEKKYTVDYTVIFDHEPDNKEDLIKTVEDKIKNLALLSEKYPINSGMFLHMLRQQLSAEVGKFGIKLKQISIKSVEIKTDKKTFIVFQK